jgi:hypothetical protein
MEQSNQSRPMSKLFSVYLRPEESPESLQIAVKAEHPAYFLYYPHFRQNRLPSKRSIRWTSDGCTSRSLANWRLTRSLFLRRRWLLICLRRRSLPRPVILNLLAVALWVFNLGISSLSFHVCGQDVLSISACCADVVVFWPCGYLFASLSGAVRF